MRILHLVQFYSPREGGMEKVAQTVSESLVKSGHLVTVYTGHVNRTPTIDKINGVDIHRFNIEGNFANGIKGDKEKFLNLIRESSFDLIVVFAAQQWTCDLFLEVIEKTKGKKIFVPTGFSGLHLPSYQSYFKMLEEKIKFFDGIIFHSERYRDYHYLQQFDLPQMCIIPNGADDIFENIKKDQYRQNSQHLTFLHVGNHTGLKGHHDAIKAYQRANIKESSVFYIIGQKNYLSPCYWECIIRSTFFNIFNRRKKIHIKNVNRSELLTLFSRADVFLFLSNIECSPISLYESCASATPFIASDAGNSQEIAEKTGGGIIVQTKKDERGYSHPVLSSIIENIEKLSNDQQLRKQMGEQAQKIWELEFKWSNIVNKYERFYESVSPK